MNPIRILHVFGKMDRGGAESMIMNIYRKIDRSKIQFDFVVHTNSEGDFDKEIYDLGGKIFKIPRYKFVNHYQYKKAWKILLDNNTNYKILHGHIRSTASIYLKIANTCGLYTIIHSHSTSSRGNFIEKVVKYFMQLPIRYTANYFFACSESAGEWLFGKKVTDQSNYSILVNAIDANKYNYDLESREKIRKKLKINNEFVLGHVGSFTKPKNHEFIIDIFQELKKIQKNSKLLLVGDGPLKVKVLEKVKFLGLEEDIIFTGSVPNVFEYLFAIDFIVFPSLFEGVPVVLVEAQASGLKVLASNVITDEIKITNLVKFKSLKRKSKEWAETIVIETDTNNRSSRLSEIISTGYDVNETVKYLQSFYEEKWKFINKKI